MAATITLRRHEVYGNKRRARVNVVPDTSYPTGGYTLTKGDCGLGTVEEWNVIGSPQTLLGYVPLFQPQPDNQSGVLKYFISDNNNAADGPLIEAANGTNLGAFNGVELEVVGS